LGDTEKLFTIVSSGVGYDQFALASLADELASLLHYATSKLAT
jgi:hypothetical protein